LEVAAEMAPDDPFMTDFLRIFSNEGEVRLSETRRNGKEDKPQQRRATMKMTSLAALILFV